MSQHSSNFCDFEVMPVEEVSCTKRLMNEAEMVEMAEYERLCSEKGRRYAVRQILKK